MVGMEKIEKIEKIEALNQLNYNGKIRRLRELAEAALTYYDLGNGRLSMLTHRTNTIFQIHATKRIEDPAHKEAARREKARYAMRLYTTSFPPEAQVASELYWLAALRKETELVVPEPVAARNGSLLTEVGVEGIPETARCVVFRWVEGRFIDSSLSPIKMERVGMFMARLHQYAEKFVPPPHFERPRWNWQWVFDKGTVLDPAFVEQRGQGLVTEHEQAIFAATAEKVGIAMRDMPRKATHYGLVHFDLQQTNYLFYKDEVRAIDFADCCWNYYLFDMAITLSGIMGTPDEAAMRAAFFEGYTQMRSLPDHYEELLKVFTAQRLIKRINYLLRSEEPSNHAKAREWIIFSTCWLEQFLAT
jgi:Ser/Thr protein kinase RdoA (MazF antagonist)